MFSHLSSYGYWENFHLEGLAQHAQKKSVDGCEK